MILEAIIDEQVYTLNVPDPVIERGGDFFDQLDRDMDQGWQMGREWVEAPDRLQRCQIIADKLLTALEKENEKLGMLMAGYILCRLPNVQSVELDIQGEIQNNQFQFNDAATPSDAPGVGVSAGESVAAVAATTKGAATAWGSVAPPVSSNNEDSSSTEPDSTEGSTDGNITGSASGLPKGLSKMQAMAQAGQDVTQVFKVGKAFRFSVFDHASASWQDSPLIATEDEAERLRQQAFKARYEALQQH
ncbi:hypothetical protein [Halochromatium sp.]